jgi:hypothetical protein
MRNPFFHQTSLFLFASLCTTSGAATALLGSILVQYVAANQELVLDMRRFFQPGDSPKLDFSALDDSGVDWHRNDCLEKICNDCVAVVFNRGNSEGKVEINVSPEMSDGD